MYQSARCLREGAPSHVDAGDIYWIKGSLGLARRTRCCKSCSRLPRSAVRPSDMEFNINAGNLSVSTEMGWKLCHDLFNSHPWWTRVWVIQEVTHLRPATAYLGNITVGVDDLCAEWRLYHVCKIERDYRNEVSANAPRSHLQRVFQVENDIGRQFQRPRNPEFPWQKLVNLLCFLRDGMKKEHPIAAIKQRRLFFFQGSYPHRSSHFNQITRSQRPEGQSLRPSWNIDRFR